MKINNINSFTTNFGHISTRTVDMIRNHVEGYKKPPHNLSSDENNSSYIPANKYRFLNMQQLIRLEKLTARAAEMGKSVVDTTGNNWQENNSIPMFVVRSHCYGGGNRSNLEVFTPTYNRSSENIKDDADYVIDALEEAIDYAQEVENDPNAHDIFDEYGWHAGVRECKTGRHSCDNFRNTRTNQVLYSIYDNTINLITIK